MTTLTIKKSDKENKKYMAIFTDKNNKKKTTHFGANGMEDYTQHKDKERRKNYRSRHIKDLETNDSTRAGYLSYYILWGNSTNLKENIDKYKKKYKYK